MEVLNRTAIKAQARDFIGQDRRWLKLILPCLPILLLSGGISFGVTVWKSYSENGNYDSIRIEGGNWALSLLLLPLTVAIAGFFLSHLRGFNPEWKALYQEGFNRYGKYFAVRFITNLIIGLWSLLLVVPGIIKSLEYSQVDFLIHDNPNLTPSQARDISRRMTDGFKGELFVMQLSFILWYMLGGITAGIAMLYVYPYLQTTNAMYYENLKNYAITTNRVSPAEFGILPVPPYAGAQPPYADGQSGRNMYGAPTAPYNAAQSDFTPPAAEDTFRPGDAADSPNTDFGGTSADGQNQNF